MSAEAMDLPRGEVLLDGRVMRQDGSWSGVKVAGEVVRGERRLMQMADHVLADVFYFETFMERLTRDLQRKDSAAVDA